MANKKLFDSLKGSIPVADGINEEGAPAYVKDPKTALATLVMTGCFSGTFYATDEKQLEMAKRLAGSVEPEFLAKLAVVGRTKGYMKDMPAFLLAFLGSLPNANGMRTLLRFAFPFVIDNGKMLRNYIQIVRSGQTGRTSFKSAEKSLLKDYFRSRGPDRIFADSVGQSPSMKDMLRIVHPKPLDAEHNALFGYLTGKHYNAECLPVLVQEFEAWKAKPESAPPNVPFRMITGVKGVTDEVWKKLAKGMRWQATRMNLNTMLRHNVFKDKEMVDMIAARLADKENVERARVFPYQLLTAYMNVNDKVPFKVKEALQDAMEIAVDNVPELPGKVAVCVDLSGSMDAAVTGYRGSATTNVTCRLVAGLMAAAILRKNKDAELILFTEHAKFGKVNPRDSVMSISQGIADAMRGGTNISSALALLNKHKAKPDTVVIVSDHESWVDCDQSERYVGWDTRQSDPTETMREWRKLKVRAKKAKLVCLDLQPYETSQVKERPDILQVAGFSDEVFNVIASFADGKLGGWVEKIEALEL